MSDESLREIRSLLERCTPWEQEALFRELRKSHHIHQLEQSFGAPAEMILEAIHRAPELTRRMLRGVIADAAFALRVVPELEKHGWRDVTPAGNFSFDYELSDAEDRKVKLQVKLQRSEKEQPLVSNGKRFGLANNMYVVEVQRTRTGKRKKGNDTPTEDETLETKTRPYKFGDFDILAVSLRPSTGDWSRFRYTVANWLVPADDNEEIRTYQPVARQTNADWTDDFSTVVKWFYEMPKKRIAGCKE